MRWHVLASSLAIGLMLACSANAGMIGMNCAGPGADGTVGGIDIGVTGLYQQSNWNNKFTAAGLPTTHYGFVDNKGDSLGTDENGFYAKVWNYGASDIATNGTPGVVAPSDTGSRDGDNKAMGGNLYTGYLANLSSELGEGATTLHLFNIPYAQFDFVVYLGNADTSMNVRTGVGATEWNVAGTPTNGTLTDQGIMAGVAYADSWQESSHDGTTGGNYFVISDLTTPDGHLDVQFYRGTTTGWGVVFAFQIVEVPEPGVLTLLGCGLLGLSVYGWRRRK